MMKTNAEVYWIQNLEDAEILQTLNLDDTRVFQTQNLDDTRVFQTQNQDDAGVFQIKNLPLVPFRRVLEFLSVKETLMLRCLDLW